MNFEVFGVFFIVVFHVYASVYDTSDRHRRPSMCTSTSTHASTLLVTALPVRGPGWSLWASGRMARRLAAGLPASACVGLVRRVRGRQTARVVSFKNRLKIYLFRRCYETA